MSTIHFYTEKDAGKSFSLEKGEVIVIALEDHLALDQTWINAHQPSSGIQYIQSSQAVLPITPPGLTAQTGLKLFVYQFVHEGAVTLHKITAGQTTATLSYTFKEATPPPVIKPLDILVMIDTAQCIAHKDDQQALLQYVYLFDNNSVKSPQHHTACQSNQSLLWQVKTISPSDRVTITGITGEIITNQIITPPQQQAHGLHAVVKTNTPGSYNYVLQVLLNSTSVSIPLTLDVVAAS